MVPEIPALFLIVIFPVWVLLNSPFFSFITGTGVEGSGSGGYGNSCDVVQRTATVDGELEFTDSDQTGHFAGGRACGFVHAGFTLCP